MRRLLAVSVMAAFVGGCPGGRTTPDAADSADIALTEAGFDGDAGGDPDATATADASDVSIPSDDSAAVDAPSDVATLVDLDHDGLDDSFEARVAHDYMPFRSFHPSEACPRQIIVYRLRPHPDNPRLLHMIVDTLLENDCGAGGHVGDDEVFGMTIDPSMPAPAGILALRSIAHQNTACEHIDNCGRCPGLSACATAMRGGVAFPAVFYSRDKHGSYLTTGSCNAACFFTNFCALSAASNDPTLVNAGEPGAALVSDLTAAGFITTATGWTEMSLFHYDPWSTTDFGGAGSVGGDLNDVAFLTPTCTL